MDQERAKLRIKVREFLATQSLEELSYILGRYCGPSNQFLSDKKFGYSMPKDLVEQELATRSMEQYLFDTK
jgi:hypothetical protein